MTATELDALKTAARSARDALYGAVKGDKLLVTEEEWDELADAARASHGEWYRAARRHILGKPGILVDSIDLAGDE